MQRALSLNTLLWIVQILLALFFAFASGAPKLVLPVSMLPLPLPLSQTFVWFIGLAEVGGALGLILPSVLRIQAGTTPVAACGLLLLTVCATVYNLLAGQPGNAVFALGMGVLAGFVGYGRWRLAPIGARTALALS